MNYFNRNTYISIKWVIEGGLLMANDRRYKRYFIILENEDRGFEKTNKQVPKGYAKIEVRNGKGLLNVYVQDLKYFKDAKYIYRNYLISTNGEKDVYVDTGSFVIDERGKGELKVKFDPDNVEGSNRTIEDFNVVAVIARPIERSYDQVEVYGPLVGYMDKEKVNWKDVLIYEEKKKAIDNNLDKQYKQKYEEIIDAIEKSSKEIYKEDNKENKATKEMKEYEGKKKEYGKDCYDDEPCVDSLKKPDNKKMKEEKKENIKADNNKQSKKENIYSEKKPAKKEEIKEEKKESEKAKTYKKENIYKDKKTEKTEPVKEEKKETKKEDIKEEKKPEKKEAIKDEKKSKTKRNDNNDNLDKKPGVHYKKYHKMVYKYVKDILKYYEKADPFEKNVEGYSWWKINYDKKSMHRGFLPFFGYILNIYCYNPYIYYTNNCESLMNKYGHYIFGISYDKDTEPKYYVYGVPGRYMYKDQPFQGMTGFVYWSPLEDKKPAEGDYGYWLLHIDAKTGNVVFPIKPTMPRIY